MEPDRCARCATPADATTLAYRQPDGTWRWTCPICGQTNIQSVLNDGSEAPE